MKRHNTSEIWINVPGQVISVDGVQFTVQVSAIKKHGMEKIKEFCRTMGGDASCKNNFQQKSS